MSYLWIHTWIIVKYCEGVGQCPMQGAFRTLGASGDDETAMNVQMESSPLEFFSGWHPSNAIQYDYAV